jgi:hypothetical protein
VTDNIRTNDDNEVVEFNGLVLEPPIPLVMFVQTLQAVRRDVGLFFEKVLDAHQGLEDAFKGETSGHALATHFMGSMKETFAKKTGFIVTVEKVEIETPVEPPQKVEVTPTTVVSQAGEMNRMNMKPRDWHDSIAMSTPQDYNPMDDLLALHFVKWSEEALRGAGAGLRAGAAVCSGELWDAYAETRPASVFPDHFEEHVTGILVLAGWRVIGPSSRNDGYYMMLPYGRGVPGVFEKTTKNDHPFWETAPHLRTE